MKKAHSKKQYSRSFLFFLILIIQSLQVGLYAQCVPSSGVISGSVFQDLNNNGIRENTEPAIGGSLITIYDKSGQLITFTNSTNTGYYSFNNLTDGQPYRLTFDYLPQYSTSFLGSDNGSNVQFVNAPACNASIGLVNLTTSCGNDPVVYTSCFVQGAVNGAYAGEPTLIGFNYSINPSQMKSMYATHGETGSVWGVAWKSETNELFSSAFVKQYSALTAHGHGAIFKTKVNGNTGATTLFANLANLGVNIGTLPVTDANQCSYGHQVGKYGIGAIALDASEEKLYAVNLYNKSLVIMPTTNPTSANTREIVIPNPNCSNGDYAPFGLKYHNDKLYITVTCTEETGLNDVNSAAVVYEFDPLLNTFTNIFSTNYLKGHWSNTPENSLATQHWFTDLDFTDDGNMVIAFTDRTGHKFCNSPSNRLDHQFPDILMVWNNNGVWTLEENGKAGSLTGTGVANGQGPADGLGQSGEFFGNDYWITQPLYHPEIALGSVFVLPGTNSVLTSAYDPANNSYSGGFQKYSTTNGSKLGAIEIYTRQTTIQFGKATGFGDIVARCGAAPIQIGNLVWFDSNKNGLQDAGEAVASNIGLDLMDDQCNILQSTTTDANGNYTFSNLEAGKLYYLAISNSVYNSQYGLVNIGGKTYSFAVSANNNSNLDNNATTLTSCGNAVMTSQYSRTNHSLDIGLVEVSEFDLALMKETVGGFVKLNGIAEFSITVYNQGAIPAKNIEITDYIPSGLEFVPAQNSQWTFANGKAKTTIEETLLPGASISRNIKLKVISSDVTKMINRAEISRSTDHNGDVHIDLDSQADTDSSNDNGGDLGTNTDDKIDDDGAIDEDDEDPAAPRVLDLALRQTIENECVIGGQCYTIKINVYNQGNTNVSSFKVTNYSHPLLTFSPDNNPGWVKNNDVLIYNGASLNKGSNQEISLELCVRDGVLNDEIVNYAEISEMKVGSTVVTLDFDSTPDSNVSNDAGGTHSTNEDNNINGVEGIEEDDHDPIVLGVKYVDLALLMTTDSRKVKQGDEACFDITVYNQGLQTMKNFTIADYIPKGLKLISENWTEVSPAVYTKLIEFEDGFGPGETYTEKVCFQVENLKDIFYIENVAEISSAYDVCNDNVSNKDIDSKADLNDKNDLGGHPQTETDNIVNGLPSLDEDDHDPAILIAYVPTIGKCFCRNNATTKDNGQFSQAIILRAPAGMTWYLDEAINYYDEASPNPPGALIPYVTGPGGVQLLEFPVNATTSDYVLDGIFEDGEYFTVIVKSTNDDYEIFNGGGCSYNPIEVIGLASICSSTEEQYEVVPSEDGYAVTVDGGTVVSSNADSSKVFIQWSATPGNYSITFKDKTPRTCNEPGILEVAVGNATTAMACKSNIQVSLDANCELLVTPSMVIAGAPQPDAPYIVMLTDDKGNPIKDNLLTKDQIGKSVMAKLIEGCGGNSCWGTLHVEDKIKPTFICNPFVEVNCYDIDGYPGPIVLDNCSDVITVNTLDSLRELLYCNDDYTMYVYKTYQAIDASGNKSAVCNQQIAVKRINMDTIVFPADIEMANALTCGGYDLDEFGKPSPTETGVPTILGSPIYPNFENECNIAVGYVDRDFGYIGCTRKIMRIWTAYESWCVTGVIKQDTQTIIIADIEAPDFTCPNDITVSASHGYCEALVNLPAITGITDDCSATFTVDVTYPFGFLNNQNGGWASFEKGEHKVTYTVYDECGNNSSCSIEVLVADKTAPVMVCDQNTTVGINSNGEAYLYAESVDDGSFDACSPINFEIRRMDAGRPCGLNEGYNNTASFCCADVGKVIIVELKGTDADNNSNTCMVNVHVQDKTVPNITCPDNVTINCEVTWDINDLDQYGVATAVDACGATVSETPTAFVDQCRVGYIRRAWAATDGSGIARCTSYIYIVKDPNALVITWPLDYATTNRCTQLDLHPDKLQAPYNKPTFNDGVCDLVGATHEDDYFPFDDGNGSCYKILRTWTVLDWCRMNEPGYTPATYQQVIKVSNNVAPTIEIDADDEACTLDDSCDEGEILLGAAAEDDCTPDADLYHSYAIDYDFDGTFTADVFSQGIGSEIDASGVYPVGTHRIIFTFEDRCGNQTSEFHDFVIKNCKAPTPSCINGTSISLAQMVVNGQPIRMACITAESINASSSHFCGYPITFSFSPDINDTIKCFTCEDLGINTINLYVTDIYGNQSFCETYIDVQNNSGGTVNITATDTEICRGESVTLTASNGSSYVWNTTPPQTTKSITVSPQVTTTYTVQVTTLDGCTLTASQEIVVNQPPTGNITGTMTICRGGSTTLTAPLGASYKWNTTPQQTTQAITVNPVSNTIYTVTVTSANGCSAVFNTTVVVNQPPIVNITGNTTICVGQSTVLTASGGGTYLWNTTPAQTTAAITVSPIVNTTYIVTVTSTQGCTATGSTTVTVNPLPTPSTTVAETSGTTNNDGIICVGASATITATGGGTYVWNTTPAQTTAVINVTPAITTTYVVTVTNANGCTATASRTITVNQLPTANTTVAETSGIANNDGIICTGASATITATGGTSYVWNTTPQQTTAAITVSPLSTTTYIVTVTNANGCTATASRTITVNPLPLVSITGDASICVGESTTLTANGGGTSFVWNTTPPQTTASITVSPTVNTLYMVTVTNSNGCSSTGALNVVVNPLPVAVITGDHIICQGLSDTLFASGAGVNGTYLWSTGATTSSIIVTPTQNTVYSVTVTSSTMCTDAESFAVTVNTDNDPVASCKDITVNLNASGEATITPAMVNDGSESGCDGAPITLTIDVSSVFCNDVQISPVTVILTVTSTGGTDTCSSHVTVNDNIDPTITCPQNLSINCSVFNGLGSLPIATATDNCPPAVVTLSNLIDVTNTCNVGTITRTFLATDASGNTAECTQIITITNNDPLVAGDIIFPVDITLNNCTTTDTSITGKVVVNTQNASCANVTVTFTNAVVGGDCNFTINRTWRVVDSCQYNAQTGAGVFTDVQVINVIDNNAPIIAGYADITINTSCTGSVDFDMSVISFTDCSDTVFVTNNSPFATNTNSGDVSGDYPEGIYDIIITATDECGNVSMDTFKLTVVTNALPHIVCHKIIVNITDLLNVVVDAEDIVLSITGLCPNDTLDFAFSTNNINDTTRVFTCDSLGDLTYFVDFYLNGVYYDSCKTLITVTDTDSLCTGNIFRIAGNIETENLEPVSNVNIELQGSGMPKANTNNNGGYFFPEMTATGEYIIKPLKDDELLKGVSTLDLIIIQRHILDIARLKSPYKMIAADINNDKKISAADLVELRKAILGMNTSFKNNTSWKTVDKEYVFPDPNNALNSNYPLYHEFTAKRGTMNVNFIGVKIGDVDQSYRASANTEKSKNGITLNQVSKDEHGSKMFSYQVQGNPRLDGFQLVFDISDVNVEDVYSSIFKDGEFHYHVDGNKLVVIAAAENEKLIGNENLFTVKTSGAGNIHSLPLMSDDLVKNEIYTDLRGNTVDINSHDAATTFNLDQNMPNPWTTSTSIPVTVGEDGLVNLEILDNIGRVVYRNNYQLKAGKNMISLTSNNIDAKGNLIYKINYNGVTKYGKMIIIE